MQIKTPNLVALSTFLLPIFVQRVFVGNSGDVYEINQNLPIQWLGFLSNFLFIFFFIVNSRHFKASNLLNWIFYALVFINFVHVMILLFVKNEQSWLPILANVRQTIWFFVCLIASGTFTKTELINGLVIMTEFTIIVIFTSRLFYEITSIPFQMMISDGNPRSQGFLSEPSTFACLLAGYLGVVIAKRNKIKIVIALLAAVATNSAIAYAGILVALSTSVMQLKVINARFRLLIGISMWFCFWLLLAVLLRFSYQISRISVDLMNYFEATGFSSTVVYSGFLARWLEAMSQLGVGIDHALGGNTSIGGGSYRFLATVKMVSEMSADGSLWFGDGLGVQAQIKFLRGESALEFGFLPFLISAFGIIFGLLIHFVVLVRVLLKNGLLYKFALPCFVVSSFNSGGGFHMYSIAIIAAVHQYSSNLEDE